MKEYRAAVNFEELGRVHPQYCRKTFHAVFPGILAPFLVESTWRRISSPCNHLGSCCGSKLGSLARLGQGTRRNVSSRFSSSLLLLPHPHRWHRTMQPASSRWHSELFVFLVLCP